MMVIASSASNSLRRSPQSPPSPADKSRAVRYRQASQHLDRGYTLNAAGAAVQNGATQVTMPIELAKRHGCDAPHGRAYVCLACLVRITRPHRTLKIPQNAEAMVGLAYARVRSTNYGWSTATEDSYAAQLELVTKATAINPGYAFAYYVKSLALIFTKQFPEAIDAAQTAVALDPNAACAYFAMGRAETPLGRCEQSIAHIKQAFTLSPRDPVGGLWHTILGVSEACLGRLDAAIAEYKRGIDAGYRTYFPYAYLAGAEAAKGNDAEAKSALAEARRLNPQLTIKSFAETLPREPIVIDGLRNAGLPEE